MSDKIKSILKRFLKGAIAGAITQMCLVSLNTPSVWTDIMAMLNTLALAGIYGFIVGALLAIQKWSSWVDQA